MENQYENLSDKLLFKIVTKIYNHLSDDGTVIYQSSSFDDEFISGIDEVIKLFGLKGNEYIEDEFLFEVIKLNLGDITKGSLSGELVRPELTEYEFDTDVHETVYQTQTWRNTISSYGNPYNLIKVIDYNGDYEYYSGREINTDIHDSQTDEIKIDRSSFREI